MRASSSSIQRLDDAVVGASVEAEDPLAHLSARCEHDDWGGDAAAAELTACGETIRIGEHPVEEDHVIGDGDRLAHRVRPVDAQVRDEAFFAEHAGDEPRDLAVVLDDEHFMCAPRIAGALGLQHYKRFMFAGSA